MSYLSKTELLEMCKRMRYDTTAMQVRITELMEAIAALPIADPETTRCPHCGPMPYGPRKLAEHMHTSHGHPHPDDPPIATPAPADEQAAA